MLDSLIAKKTFKVSISFVFTFLTCSTLLAQTFRTNHWIFPMGNRLDFTSGSPVTDTSSMTGEMGTSSICDENGDLVFYSNGNKVWQANHVIMGGGNNLVGDPQATQSSIIVPSTHSATRYYLFVNDANAGPAGFNYYDVEMQLNGGNGGVVGPTNLLDTATEKMAATRHGNDKGYWVVAHGWENNAFHAFLVDENGVNTTPVTSNVGFAHLNSSGAGEETGQMKISPDGEWLVTCNFSSGYVQLFRFDNTTGVVSDPITLTSGNSVFPYGVEFSADSKKLFYARRVSNAANPAGIHQFDLDHASIDCLLASEVVISNNNPFKLYTDLQLGLDKRIYVSYYKPSPFNADTLGRIAEPEVMCPECDYTDNYLLLENSVFSGVTNFVSSFLSDGITYEFGTNCEDDSTWFMPEDTLGLDSVNWNFGDPSTGALNTSNQIHAAHVFSSAPDTFLVTLLSYRGSNVDTFRRNVIVWDTAVDLIGPDTTLCTGQSITFDATWYDACVVWEDSSTNLTYTTNEEGYHNVTILHQSCVWTDSVLVTIVDDPPQFSLGNDTSVCADVSFVIDPDLQNAFYTWQDGSHDTTFAVTSTGSYWLQASNSCGTTTDTLNVILNEAAQPVLNFPADTIGCDTIGIELDVTFEDAVYEWNDALTQPIRTIVESGLYWVEVGNSCDTVRDSINVQIDAPLFSVLPEREVVCSYLSDTLTLLATADSQSVVWSNGSVGPTFSTLSFTGQLWFEQTNACGSRSDTIQILDYDSSYNLVIGKDTTVCGLGDTVLIGDAADDFPWTYDWNTNQISALILAAPGTYELTARHRCDTITQRLEIRKAPRVVLDDSTTTTLCQGDTISIGLTRSGLASISWSTGEATERILMTSSGDYFVSVVDSFGCAHIDSIGLNDFCPGSVFIPNVFTPNGDGINDEFCLKLENIVEYSFSIYDRWGSEILFHQDEGTCWDGKIQGSEAPDGVYYYLLDTRDALNESASFRGAFSLLRN